MAVNRVTGLTGFDTEGMVTKLMNAERAKMTRVVQSKQYKTWEQEAYRGVIDKFASFKSDYYDILKPGKNFGSGSAFTKFTSTTTVNGTASSKVEVVAGNGVKNFNHTISQIEQLATKDTHLSTTTTGFSTINTGTPNFGSAPAAVKINLVVDGISKSLEFSAGTNITELKDNFNSAIVSKFGTSFSNMVSVDGGSLDIKKLGNTVTVLAQTGDVGNSIGWLGLTSGASSNSYMTQPISTLFPTLDLNKTINGKKLSDMGIQATDTLTKMMDKINSSGTGVTMAYDSLADKLKLASNSEGVANKVDATDVFTMFGLLADGGAQDAKLTIDGVAIVKSTNTFALDGVSYTLKETHNTAGNPADPINIGIKVDSSSLVAEIKGYIESYNTLIKSVGDQLSEQKYRKYLPLTDEQKKEMKPEDIKLWEDKSKSGILKGKSEIEGVLNSMRQALMEKVDGVGLTLKDIGIDTTSNYKDRGKLVIEDESKLKSAIENKYTDVVNLFSKKSSTVAVDETTRAQRMSENGLANRLYDIIETAAATTAGSQGFLIKKAGSKTSLSTENTISKQILEYDKKVSQMIDYLAQKENYYYSMFARVEKALSQMNSQSGFFQNQG